MTSSEHTGSGASVTLYEFPLSHYNEKARWVLDYKQVPYRSHPVLPGFHFGTIRRLSGQTETPVVQIGDEVVSGSTNIVARIDAMKSDRSLFPTAPEARKETLEWVTWLDDEVGPAADLTAGALFFPLFYPKELRSGVPDRSRPVFKGWLDRWCDHPGRDYIEGLFRKHR